MPEHYHLHPQDGCADLEEFMDIEKSFAFPFEDKEWTRKLGLGAIISIVPILNFAWTGYMVGIIRNVMDNVTEPLPSWDDLGKRFMDGLILFAAGLVYALPMLLLLCLPLGMLASAGVLSGNSNMEDIARTMGGAGGVLLSCLLCVFFLYGIVLSIIYPAILVMFAREGTFASCFKFSEVFGMIGRNAGPFFTAWALSLAVSLGVGLVMGVINLVLSWIPCLGQIISLATAAASLVYSTIVYAHLFGQVGKAAFGQAPLVTAG